MKYVEPQLRRVLHESLQQCRAFKDAHRAMAQNVMVIVVIGALVAAYVWSAYRNAPSREEMARREAERHAFVLQSIRVAEKKERQRLLEEQWNNPAEWSGSGEEEEDGWTPPPFFGTLTAAYD